MDELVSKADELPDEAASGLNERLGNMWGIEGMAELAEKDIK